MVYSSEINLSSSFFIVFPGLIILTSLSFLMFMCFCFHKTRDSIRLKVSDIDSCLRKKRFLWSRNDSNNNAAKTNANGNLTASSNGYLKVGNPNQSANCSPEVLHLVKSQVSRDRELPPVPQQAGNSPQIHYGTKIGGSLQLEDDAPDNSFQDYEPLPHLTRSVTSCSDTGGLKEVKLRHGRHPRDSVTQQQMMSVCDTESEIDPLYSSVLPQGQSSRNSFRSNSQVWRVSMSGQDNPLTTGRSQANDPNSNHVYGSVWPKTSGGGAPLYARIFKSKAERLSRMGSPPRYTPSSCGRSSASPYEDIAASGPACRCMPASDSFSSITGPPVPPRSYGQSEVDLVVESRLEELNAHRQHHPSCSFSTQESSSNVSNHRRERLRLIPIRNLEAIPGSPRRFSQPVFGSLSSCDSPTTSSQSPDEPQSNSKSNSHLNSGILSDPSEERIEPLVDQFEFDSTSHERGLKEPNQSRATNQIYETLYEGVYSSSTHLVLAPKFITREHRNISFDAASDAYDEIGDQKNSNLCGNDTAVLVLQEMKTFRHMDSDVDLSKTCSPLTVPGATTTSLNPNHPSRHIYSSVNKPAHKSNTSKSPHQILEGRLASNEDLSRPHTPQQTSSSYNLIGFMTKPVMTPLMERSIEGSLLDEPLSSGIDADDKSPDSDSYSFLEDFTSGLASMDCKPISAGQLSSSIRSTDTASSFYAALSAATSLQPSYYAIHRNRTESEASSLL